MKQRHTCRAAPGFGRARSWLAGCLLLVAFGAQGVVLWRDPTPRLAFQTGAGSDLLHGAVKPQDDTSSGTLYFACRVEPLSDGRSESKSTSARYVAGLVLFDGDKEHLGVGNAWVAWGYSAYNASTARPTTATPGEIDLNSPNQEIENLNPYEAPRRGIPRTLMFRVQYFPGGDDLVTVWLDPVLTPGSSEIGQNSNRVTQFKADASFNELRLIHRGGGEGWRFSNLAIGTSFDDFVERHLWERGWFIGLAVLTTLVTVGLSVMVLERRRSRRKIQRLEQARALEAERTRIAQDLHDELGVQLTEISLLGNHGHSQSGDREQLAGALRLISAIAREAVQTADGIVWAVNPQNDTLHHLGNYLVQFVEEFFGLTSIHCRLDVPVELPPVHLSSEIRHHLLLAVKEACHNTARHSGATEMWLRLALKDSLLVISVEDNGRGFDPQTVPANGNGLRNLRNRMASVGGDVEISTTPGGGTRITLLAPLPRQ